MTRTEMLLRLLPMLGALLFPGAASAAPVSFNVHVSTQSGEGYPDFQFNPGFGAAQATASVSDFSLESGGTLLLPVDTVFPLPFQTPTALGDLNTQVAISNAASLNAFLQRLEFGSSFRFVVSLAGPALDAGGNGGGTNFVLLQYDKAGNTLNGGRPLLTLAIGPDADLTPMAGDGVPSKQSLSPRRWPLLPAH
jgi:hypothetical protein